MAMHHGIDKGYKLGNGLARQLRLTVAYAPAGYVFRKFFPGKHDLLCCFLLEVLFLGWHILPPSSYLCPAYQRSN